MSAPLPAEPLAVLIVGAGFSGLAMGIRQTAQPLGVAAAGLVLPTLAALTQHADDRPGRVHSAAYARPTPGR